MTADDSYGRIDDEDYPAYTIGRAAEMLGTTQGFLRAIGEARLVTPLRSAGGHRRYSRYQLRIAGSSPTPTPLPKATGPTSRSSWPTAPN
ncbi:MerR family transcriptional regulator [Streptomyces rimosus]|uniref:MerR family transcriptional regulator n=1 Tax=Streptomyces rimosus TaxID=1927 RepID=UPI000A891F64|nr:MerR family transcriptional regulator [Streptomyces rimosus]